MSSKAKEGDQFSTLDSRTYTGSDMLSSSLRPWRGTLDSEEALRTGQAADSQGAFHPGNRASERSPLSGNGVSHRFGQYPVAAWYQPKIDMATGRVVGLEALARVIDPARGALSPCELLRGATAGTLEDLTIEILSQAVATQRRLHSAGHTLDIAVNVTATLIERHDMRNRLLECVREGGGDASRIVLEIVETEQACDLTALIRGVEALCAQGFRFAADDFGTGYNTLLRLIQISFTELKVDRAFVRNAGSDPHVRGALEACVLLGKRFGLVVTAEGVETCADLEITQDFGCDYAQGYLISRPLSAHAIREFLLRWQPNS
ncbi:EAL domain-containing protein (putative c-di-GMP-specific phosphodiesterase class I) [Paraburkholderia silvatlantica]|uniref:EAL domain-containing protein (Putative c-di-GMP-specific phosphodiesterase class I) n=1 Tax=Paraburkholderia silvatlantica TaxID=321895 RepID=A0A2V4TH38_9BURK|nr:EAL domain-containing protein [Paraburkholderia silvatlantica]PYE12253.1 EAL domain-containing protein (putative c-di-GMP-specific phosphodiesterase class I) [Paraburkholderia silvatlantica]